MRDARMLCVLLGVAALVATMAGPAHAEETPPEPSFNGVDHRTPASHLGLSPQVGDAARITSLAKQLKGVNDEATLSAIFQWMHRNLKHDKHAGKRWRSMDEMLKDRTYGGCADHAVVFGTLTRAAGIPAIWVKSMNLDWIHEFRAGRAGGADHRGHVFLEVHLGGRWQLLDAESMTLYPQYDPRTRVLPGNRLAYDKGDDPYTLVLPCRGDLWRRQAEGYFTRLEASSIPWGRTVDLLAPWRVWVAGSGPVSRYASEACRRLGYHVAQTFSSDWERVFPQARGMTLIVTCEGRRPVLPETWWNAVLPPGWRGVVEGKPLPADGYLAHRLRDGTRVVLLTGQDITSVQVGVAKALSAARR